MHNKGFTKSYKNLIVWQRSIQLSDAIYELIDQFPWEEEKNLSLQMRKSVVSISSNIAEGRCRGTKKDYLKFLRIAYASGAELETQIIISKRQRKTKHLDYKKADSLMEEVMKMLNAMIRNLNPLSTTTTES